VAGLSEPYDRVIDGVNQLDWLTGQASSSQREGYIFWMGPEMYGAKWRNFKLALVEQKYSTDPPARLTTPRIINLTVDPQEREPLALPYLHTWVVPHFNRIIGEYRASIKHERPIPVGARLDHVPTSAGP
jgi:hypothetical protein